MFPNRFSFAADEPKQPIHKWSKLLWQKHVVQSTSCCTYTDFESSGGFHQAIGSTLVMAQCFAVMPVINIKNDSVSKLRFSWKNIRTIYSTIAIICLISYTLITIRSTVNNEINLKRIGRYLYLINEF